MPSGGARVGVLCKGRHRGDCLRGVPEANCKNQSGPMKPEILTSEENGSLLNGTCPDCGSRMLISGPEGGLTMNVLCGGCLTEFNESFIQSERIGQPCEKERQEKIYGLADGKRPVAAFYPEGIQTRKELDAALRAAGGKHELLILGGSCHPKGPVFFAYRSEGYLEFRCAACGRLISKISVEP